MKKKVGIFIHESVADALDRTALRYANKKGLCVTAAILMFLDAEPEVQRQYMERVAVAEVDGSLSSLIGRGKLSLTRSTESLDR